jgi:hypothetical protein
VRILNAKGAAIRAIPALAAGLFGAIWATANTPTLAAGPNIAVLAGARVDAHLVTRWLLEAVPAPERAHANIVAFGLLVAIAAALCVRGSSVASLVGGFAAGAVIATSPLATGILADPLGVEIAVTLAIVFVLLADCAGLIDLPPAGAIALSMGAALQDYLLLPMLLLYATWRFYRGERWSPALAAGVVGSACVAFFVTNGMHAPARLDRQAAAATAIFSAIVLFVVAPAALTIRNSYWFRRLHWEGRPSIVPLLAGAVLTALSVFAANADPTSYWLCLEVALVFVILRAAGPLAGAVWSGSALLIVVAAIQLVTGSYLTASPVAAASRQVSTIARALSAHQGAVCLYGKPDRLRSVLSDGAVLKVYHWDRILVPASSMAECDAGPERPGALIALNGDDVEDYGSAGVPIATAMERSQSAAMRLATLAFTVIPDTATTLPGGRGAFVDDVATPLGAAKDVTIAAPFTAVFHCVSWNRGDTLSAAIANPLGTQNGSGRVRYSVGNFAAKPIGDGVIEPSPGASGLPWRYIRVALPGTASCTNLAFSARVEGANGDGTWVAFLEPSILGRRGR